MTGSTNTHPGLSIDTDAEVLLDSECSVTINAKITKTNLILHKLTLHTFDCHNLKFSKFTYLSLTHSLRTQSLWIQNSTSHNTFIVVAVTSFAMISLS